MNDKLYYWTLQEPLLQKIAAYGSMEEYVKNGVGNIEKAFHIQDKNLRCMDERTPGGFHLAGSGILLLQEKAIEIAKEMGIEGIWRHSECGAEVLYARLHNLDLPSTQKEIEERAKKLASSLKIAYEGVLEVKPKGFHIARVAYYMGVKEFDASQVKELPPGFIISRRFIDSEYAKKELDIGIGIALGDHGFGKRFTESQPFIVIPIADAKNPEFSLERLAQEAKEVAQKEEYRGRVIVDGFIAQSEF